jgi:hypothetical protein
MVAVPPDSIDAILGHGRAPPGWNVVEEYAAFGKTLQRPTARPEAVIHTYEAQGVTSKEKRAAAARSIVLPARPNRSEAVVRLWPIRAAAPWDEGSALCMRRPG